MVLSVALFTITYIPFAFTPPLMMLENDKKFMARITFKLRKNLAE